MVREWGASEKAADSTDLSTLSSLRRVGVNLWARETSDAAARCVRGVFGRICNVSDFGGAAAEQRVALLGSLPEGGVGVR